MTSSRFITAFEHQPLRVTEEGSEGCLTPVEVERLAAIGEQRPGFCEVGYRSVKLAQYCGVVGLGDRVLEVLPKTSEGIEAEEQSRGVLLRLLRLTERFPRFQHSSVGQHLWRASLLEAFIAAFFEAVTTLTRGGLLKQYLEHEQDLTVVRGRIAAGRQLGAHANRCDLVACVFDELTVDNVWNRTLKRAVRCTRPWIRGIELHRQWVELMGVLDEVDDAALNRRDAARLVFNRQANRYRDAIRWARWILDMLSPDLRSGSNEAPALLFDMNRLFESAVASMARTEVFRKSGLTVESQDRSRALATISSADSVEQVFPLRPDLVFRGGSSVVAIADTKWKLLERDRRGRPMPSEGDMYQMHAYASAYRCHELALIFPWHSALATTTSAAFRLPQVDGYAPRVNVICIDIHDDSLPLRLGHWPTSPAPYVEDVLGNFSGNAR